MINKILTIATVILALAVICLSVSNGKLMDERNRYKANQQALLSNVKYYKTENGKSAASVKKLTLSYDELKEHYKDVCKVAKDLDIKVKRMQSASTTATRTEIKVVTEIRDSIVYRDSIKERIQVFRWNDPWVSILGKIERDSIGMNVESRDTLTQIVHRVPHKFWFIKWGTKAIRQDIVSSNPHTKITYSEYIELK